MSDDDLLDLLRVISEFAEGSDPVDSSDVSRKLGWSDTVTASSLAEARTRLFIWGLRVGGTPGPRFEDIELTVQGRRLLLAVGPTADGEPPASGAHAPRKP